jgi:hypothetical protein
VNKRPALFTVSRQREYLLGTARNRRDQDLPGFHFSL